MGTRGLFGFYYKGKYYLVYNHWDSYPEGLGHDLLREIKYALENNLLDNWIQMLIDSRVVSDEISPTSEDINKLNKYWDLSVDDRSPMNWYCLTRKCQGSFLSVLESGYIYTDPDYENKLTGDIFVEYSYVLDFDNMRFVLYESGGFTDYVQLDQTNLDTEWTNLLTKLNNSFNDE